MKKSKKVSEEIWNIRNSLSGKYNELLKAIFEDHSALKSFTIGIKEEYDDNNYYDRAYISQINGIDAPEGELSEYSIEEEGENDNYKAFFFACKIKQDDLSYIVSCILDDIPASHWSSSGYGEEEIKRENYASEKSKKTAKA